MSPVLGKAIRILEIITADVRGQTAVDVAEAEKIPRQTAHRILRQLEDLELVQREPGSERFTVGPRLKRLALASISKFQQTQVTHTILQELVADVRETCNIGMLDSNQVVYIDRVECDWPLKVHLEPGSHVPVHCTAIGKLLLAHAESGVQRRILAVTKLTKYTENTITDPRRLDLALEEIRERGYSTNNGEDAVGLVALAVPVKDPRGDVIAGLAVHAPDARVPLKTMLSLRPRMETAAARIGSVLFDTDH